MGFISGWLVSYLTATAAPTVGISRKKAAAVNCLSKLRPTSLASKLLRTLARVRSVLLDFPR